MHFGMTGMIMVSLLPFSFLLPPSTIYIYPGNLFFEKDEELLLRC
jgi:hypothetical protein